MRRISYILLLGILYRHAKEHKVRRHELTCRGDLSNKKTEIGRSREYTFYQGPTMRRSYLSASMAPS